jgi:uncharacterized coiled-coil DUF342 family protein
MTAIAEKINEELNDLKRIRDELRVQVHLGAAETRELWEKTEERFGQLESRLGEFKRDVREPLHDVGDATRFLLDEIKDAYREIRGAL